MTSVNTSYFTATFTNKNGGTPSTTYDFSNAFVLDTVTSLSKKGYPASVSECNDVTCVVSCSCNTANGWSDTAPTSGDYVKAVTNKSFAYTISGGSSLSSYQTQLSGPSIEDGATTSSYQTSLSSNTTSLASANSGSSYAAILASNGTSLAGSPTLAASSAPSLGGQKTCYKKTKPDCDDGYIYYDETDRNNMDTNVYRYTRQSNYSTSDYYWCLKPECGDVYYSLSDTNTDTYLDGVHVYFDNTRTAYRALVTADSSDADLNAKVVSKTDTKAGLECYHQKWPSHIIFEYERNDTIKTCSAKADGCCLARDYDFSFEFSGMKMARGEVYINGEKVLDQKDNMQKSYYISNGYSGGTSGTSTCSTGKFTTSTYANNGIPTAFGGNYVTNSFYCNTASSSGYATSINKDGSVYNYISCSAPELPAINSEVTLTDGNGNIYSSGSGSSAIVAVSKYVGSGDSGGSACPSGYSSTIPNGGFTYTTSSGCYKVTGCASGYVEGDGGDDGIIYDDNTGIACTPISEITIKNINLDVITSDIWANGTYTYAVAMNSLTYEDEYGSTETITDATKICNVAMHMDLRSSSYWEIAEYGYVCYPSVTHDYDVKIDTNNDRIFFGLATDNSGNKYCLAIYEESNSGPFVYTEGSHTFYNADGSAYTGTETGGFSTYPYVGYSHYLTSVQNLQCSQIMVSLCDAFQFVYEDTPMIYLNDVEQSSATMTGTAWQQHVTVGGTCTGSSL